MKNMTKENMSGRCNKRIERHRNRAHNEKFHGYEAGIFAARHVCMPSARFATSISGIIVSRLNFPSVQYDSISGSARKANREIVLGKGDIVLSTWYFQSGRFRVSEAAKWNLPQTIISSTSFDLYWDFVALHNLPRLRKLKTSSYL